MSNYTNFSVHFWDSAETNPDLDATPPPPRSLLLFAVRFFILAVKLEAE
jgi:hypothetical protein